MKKVLKKADADGDGEIDLRELIHVAKEVHVQGGLARARQATTVPEVRKGPY